MPPPATHSATGPGRDKRYMARYEAATPGGLLRRRRLKIALSETRESIPETSSGAVSSWKPSLNTDESLLIPSGELGCAMA